MRKLAAQRSIYLGTFWRRSFRAAPLANRTRTRGWRWHRRRAHWSCGPAQAESPPRRAGRCCHAPQSERAPRYPNLVWSAKRETFARVVTGLHKNANLAADNPTCDITTTPRPLVTKPRPDHPGIGCPVRFNYFCFSPTQRVRAGPGVQSSWSPAEQSLQGEDTRGTEAQQTRRPVYARC